jgi:hypothetical protein
MKKIVVLLSLLPFFSFAQNNENTISLPLDSATNEIVYTEVVKVDSVSAADLYSRAKLFVADVYKSSKDVTQLNDDASKTILIKPITYVQFSGLMTSAYSANVQYQLKIEIKDNRYRYRIEGFDYYERWDKNNRVLSLSEPKMRGLPQKIWDGILERVDINMKSLISVMKNHMDTPISDF